MSNLAVFETAYIPGVLTAVAYRDGVEDRTHHAAYGLARTP